MTAAEHMRTGPDRAADPHHDSHTHALGGGGGHGEGGEAHGSLRGYLTGFVLSVILTAVPFWLVMDMPLPNPVTVGFIVVGLAVVQIVVHMVFFLHMSPRSEGGWTLMALGFTLVIVVITISGSLWVMYHLNTNMMPGHEMEMEGGTVPAGATVPGGPTTGGPMPDAPQNGLPAQDMRGPEGPDIGPPGAPVQRAPATGGPG